MSSSRNKAIHILDRLYEIVAARRDERPTDSYVVSLLDAGHEAIAAKIQEESAELIAAARDESDDALAHEVADLIFHVWVMMASRQVEPTAVYAELDQRFGVGGLIEKASRNNAGEGGDS